MSNTTWAEIERNYPPSTRNVLQQLIDLERPAKRGKLIVWHGDPETGKTTALRAFLVGFVRRPLHR